MIAVSRQIAVSLLAAAALLLAGRSILPSSAALAFSRPLIKPSVVDSSARRWPAVAFAPSAITPPSSSRSSPASGGVVVLFMSEEDSTESTEEPPASESSVSTPPVDSAAPPAAVQEPEGTDYPLNVPSPILLASSMVLGIASIGSVFELSGGSPANGFAASAAIAALGFPLCIFLFYAAIRKGQAETEEDDKRFLNK